jgi:hypothetical protein
VGAGTRGTRKGLPAVHALAPTHAGLTMLEQPTVWWHLWERTDTRVDVTLSIANVEDPLLEVTLPSPTEAGWHALRLTDHGTRLEKGNTYEWFVALVPDPEQRSRDVIARGIIERRDPPAELRRELAATPPNRAFEVLARHGYWYEAVSNLSEQSRAAPGKTQLRAARASLLEQIGQDDLAERERDSVSAQ